MERESDPCETKRVPLAGPPDLTFKFWDARQSGKPSFHCGPARRRNWASNTCWKWQSGSLRPVKITLSSPCPEYIYIYIYIYRNLRFCCLFTVGNGLEITKLCNTWSAIVFYCYFFFLYQLGIYSNYVYVIYWSSFIETDSMHCYGVWTKC